MIRFKKISTVIFSSFMCLSAIVCPVFADGKYAKVVFLSGDGTGKTSVLHVLSTVQKAPSDIDHSDNLDVRERFFEFDENEQHYSVNTKLWDTSGERVHRPLIKEFCTNATVAVITLDLEKLGKKPYTTQLARDLTWNWIDELDRVAPNCKLVFVGTKKDKVEGIAFDQAKDNVRHIANFDSVRGRVGERIMYISAQKDNPQEVCNTLNRLIADAIKDYGLANLQDRPTKMSAKLVKDIPKRRVTKTGTKTVSVTVPKFKKGLIGIVLGFREEVNIEDGTTTKDETVSYDYTVTEDDPANATYKIEYYGEF